MNKRLLKYKLPSINYDTKNKMYLKKQYSKMLAWYLYNEYTEIGLILALKALKKYSDRNMFRLIQEHFPMIQEQIKDLSRDEVLNMIENKPSTCVCGKPVKRGRQFCSSKCANNAKVTDSFKEKLSNSIKLYHTNLSENDKHKRNEIISNGNKEFYKNESFEDKQKRLSKLKPELTAFKTLYGRLQDTFYIKFDEDYYYNNKELKFVCKTCNTETLSIKSTSPVNPICRTCNPYNQERAQQDLFNNIDYPNKRLNDRTIIKPYELDILLGTVAVEYCGLMWHSYGKSKHNMFNNYNNIDPNRHLFKLELCKSKGIHLFTFFENEFKYKRDIVISMINSRLGKSITIPARKCKIKELSNEEANTFIENNHIQGKVNSSVKFGLVYQDQIVACMTLGKSRLSKSYQWEIYRYCNKLNTTVTGGFSKILKHFERTYNPDSLVSYANMRWSDGNVYKVNDFTLSHISKPNPHWFMYGTDRLLSRSHFQKHKLKDTLDNFNPNETAVKNMFNNNFRVIYDCGNQVWYKKY